MIVPRGTVKLDLSEILILLKSYISENVDLIRLFSFHKEPVLFAFIIVPRGTINQA